MIVWNHLGTVLIRNYNERHKHVVNMQKHCDIPCNDPQIITYGQPCDTLITLLLKNIKNSGDYAPR